MADYRNQQILQRPPGYIDPTTPPMRKPIPSPYRPPKPHKNRSFCRFCCCFICITLILFLFLLLLSSAIFYLWFDPKLPTFSLSSFRLDKFNISVTDLDGGASLSSSTMARVEIKNPNSKLVFYYGNTIVETSIGQGNDEIGMGETKINGFKQSPKNLTSLKLETFVKNQSVEKSLATRLMGKYESKELVINVIARSKVGFGFDGIKIGMLAVNLRCGGVTLNKLDTDSPKCTLNTLKWVNIK